MVRMMMMDREFESIKDLKTTILINNMAAKDVSKVKQQIRVMKERARKM